MGDVTIREEITTDILTRTLGLGPGAVTVQVTDRSDARRAHTALRVTPDVSDTPPSPAGAQLLSHGRTR
ncbi:hypothetical protein GCM10022206_25400 [Streptomyces chiangmaiensis]